jgi:hypothetical protein
MGLQRLRGGGLMLTTGCSQSVLTHGWHRRCEAGLEVVPAWSTALSAALLRHGGGRVRLPGDNVPSSADAILHPVAVHMCCSYVSDVAVNFVTVVAHGARDR